MEGQIFLIVFNCAIKLFKVLLKITLRLDEKFLYSQILAGVHYFHNLVCSQALSIKRLQKAKRPLVAS